MTLRAKAHGVQTRLRATRQVWRRGGGVSPEPAAPEPPDAVIDTPAPGQGVARSTVVVRGWAHAAGAPVDRVELTLDGAPASRARLGILRPDVHRPGMPEHVIVSGFEGTVELRDLPADRATAHIGARAVTRDGAIIELDGVDVELRDDELDVWPDASARGRVLRERAERVVAGVRSVADATDAARPVRALVVTHDLGFGGAPLVLQDLLTRFGPEGITGVVVAPEDGATREVIEASGFAVHIAGESSRHDIEAYEGWLARTVAWAAPQGFDVVVVNTLLCAHDGGELAARLGLPTVWIVHESYDLAGFWALYGEWLHPYIRARGTAAFERAGAVIFEVDATRRLLEPAARPGSCVTIPYGIDVDALDAWGREWSRGRARELIGAGPQDLVVLCVGTIEPRKAQASLVEAFARVASFHPHSRLILVGGRGDGLERAPQIAVAAHGLGSRVGIEPIHPDVRPYYRAADVLVCASDVESLPRSVLEAMALGVPVVATTVFGLPEVVEDGGTGWLCEPRDVAALANALRRALEASHEERAELGRRARDVVRADHDVERCASRYAAVVRDVVGPRGSVTGAPDTA